MKTQPLSRLIALASISFALSIASNTLEPSVFGHKVLELMPDRPNTALGLITFASSIVAIIFSPIFGTLSDRTNSRLGKRIPYLLIGSIFLILGLYLIAISPTLGVFFTSVIIFQLAHSAIVSPWQALYPDLVPKHQRGSAAGIRSMADIVGLVIGRKFAGDILAQFDQLGQLALFRTVAIPSIALLLAVLIIIWSIRSQTSSDVHKPPQKFSWKDIYLVDFKSHPAFAWWFVNRFFFWAAFTSLATFLLFFAIDVIGLPQGIAQEYLGNLALILGGAILVITLFSGWLADRVGRKPLVIGAGLLAAFGSIIVMFARDLILLAVAGAIIGTAAAIFISANFALITDIVPRKEAARYLGVSLIASASGGAFARLIGAALVDPVNIYFDSNSLGYMALYATASILFLFSSLAALRLHVPDTINSSNP